MFRRYHKLSELGRGGMGVTFLAWDTKEQRVVVLKQPRDDLLGKPRLLERFDREIRVAASLRHPHILGIIDHGVENGVPYFVMPFLPGGSLLKRAGRRRRLKESRFHLWLPAIAAALDYAHADANGGVIHRDVKPANILFDARWNAFLSDFGVTELACEPLASNSSDALTQWGVVPGTLRYTSPECLRPNERASGRSDQFSLAVTVYELACGRKPFTGTQRNIYDEILNHDPPPLRESRPTLPKSFCDAVHKALAKAPDDRFASCEAFAAAALADVPRVAEDTDWVRMVCPVPGCETLVRFSPSHAGKQLQCPTCCSPFTVAHDLGCLETPKNRRLKYEFEWLSEAVAGGPADDGEDDSAANACSALSFPELLLAQSAPYRDPDQATTPSPPPSAVPVGKKPATIPPQKKPRPDPTPVVRYETKDWRIIRGMIAGLAIIALVLLMAVFTGRRVVWHGGVDLSKNAEWVDEGHDGIGRIVVPTPTGWMCHGAKTQDTDPPHLITFWLGLQEVGPSVCVIYVPTTDSIKNQEARVQAAADTLLGKHAAAFEESNVTSAQQVKKLSTSGKHESIWEWGYEISGPHSKNKPRKCYATVINSRVYVVQASGPPDGTYLGRRIFNSRVNADEAALVIAREMKATRPYKLSEGIEVRSSRKMPLNFVPAARQLNDPAPQQFLLGPDPVTCDQWRAVMGDSRWWPKEDGASVAEGITRDKAVTFCRKLTDLERRAGSLPPPWSYTIPNEAHIKCQRGPSRSMFFPKDVPEWRVPNNEYVQPLATSGTTNVFLCDHRGNPSKKSTGSLRVALVGVAVGDK